MYHRYESISPVFYLITVHVSFCSLCFTNANFCLCVNYHFKSDEHNVRLTDSLCLFVSVYFLVKRRRIRKGEVKVYIMYKITLFINYVSDKFYLFY